MRKLLVIARHEFRQALRTKIILMSMIVLPISLAALMAIPGLIATHATGKTETIAILDRTGRQIGSQLKQALTEPRVRDSIGPAFDVVTVLEQPPATAATNKAVYDSLVMQVHRDRLTYLLVIGSDAVSNDSSLILVSNATNMVSERRISKKLQQVLASARLAEAHVALSIDSVLALTHPPDLLVIDSKAALGLARGAVDPEASFAIGLLLAMLLFFLVLMSANVLTSTTIKEKQSRIMEVLVSSASPLQIMFGKILGSGSTFLLQTGLFVFLPVGFLFVWQGFSVSVDPSLSRILLNPVTLAFVLAFYVCAYLMYAAFFTMVGGILNNERDSSYFAMPATFFLMSPLYIFAGGSMDPNSAFVQALSFIPPLTPSVMIMRIVAIVPLQTSPSLFSGIVG
ncbi:MAG: ABC transporter permease, partial [Candidatus Zixiibacteriota bacterium]